ncbi:MAG: ATP-binding protein [Phototrophicaceae bacterium]
MMGNSNIHTAAEIDRLRKVQEATLRMALVPELDPLMNTIVTIVGELIENTRVILLLRDDEKLDHLRLGAVNVRPDAATDYQRLKRAAAIDINPGTQDAIVRGWLRGELSAWMGAEDELAGSPVEALARAAGFEMFYSQPLMVGGDLLGMLLVELEVQKHFKQLDIELLDMLAGNIAVILHNTCQHKQAVEQLAASMHEMNMLQQIDRELNETIHLPTVFDMTLDWALRFTNASAASLALYDAHSDQLRTHIEYGHPTNSASVVAIAERVAHSGRVEVVVDQFGSDDDRRYRSQMAMPVLREDSVVAVITLESRKADAFSQEHVDFVNKLANRAGVAIDNARLYDATVREREKLTHILGSIADIVVIVAPDHRILVISQSAISALNLQPGADYTHQPFAEVVGFQPLAEFYRRAVDSNDGMDEEFVLPNGRIYYTRATPQPGIGCTIVMQDITLFKEMDRLKSELIATVSHDLKQPLGVMRGYLDLLQMKNEFDSSSMNFVHMIENAIDNMRQLIDDLLDLARIESGAELDLKPVLLPLVLRKCLQTNLANAEKKSMTIIDEIAPDLPLINGEQPRLAQIFNNLIGNAIKYTPAGGTVRVRAENRGATVRVLIEDDGMGISPEDQSHIFERFYRVRRPETEKIDGTGLGLAIVKRLVDAHHGRIRVESKLGEGTTFYVTLPIYSLV